MPLQSISGCFFDDFSGQVLRSTFTFPEYHQPFSLVERKVVYVCLNISSLGGKWNSGSSCGLGPGCHYGGQCVGITRSRDGSDFVEKTKRKTSSKPLHLNSEFFLALPIRISLMCLFNRHDLLDLHELLFLLD